MTFTNLTFKQAVLTTPVMTTTTNGMAAYEGSLDACVDLFFAIGASRGKNITGQFEKALAQNPEIALRIVQWARDAREGAGERELFRQVLRHLEQNHRALLLSSNILSNVSWIGRWDDLLSFTSDQVLNESFALIREALDNRDGLCAKWMPRKGPMAARLRTYLGWSPKFYRKRLVELTSVVETQMCAKQWNEINFSHVPSVAMGRYTKAFNRNAPDHFAAFKEKLVSGDKSVKVNAGAVYPHDVINVLKTGDQVIANEQWKALPNYLGDELILPLVDVSASMDTPVAGTKKLTAMDAAIALGLYVSDKNTGPFKDMFLTFTDQSKFVHLNGSLQSKWQQMQRADWSGSTNLESAFDQILSVAVNRQIAPDQMPKVLLILSDMQFNQACRGHNDTAMRMIQRRYEAAGYTVPNIVFWNLCNHSSVPATFDQSGTAMISGFSPSIMKAVLSGDMEAMTPQRVMLAAISNKRYDVKI